MARNIAGCRPRPRYAQALQKLTPALFMGFELDLTDPRLPGRGLLGEKTRGLPLIPLRLLTRCRRVSEQEGVGTVLQKESIS